MKNKVLFLLLITMLLAPLAYASEESEDIGVIGSFTGTRTITSVKTDTSGNTIITFTATLTFTGGLAGTFVGIGTVVTHPDNTFTSELTGTFTGSVLGSPLGTAILTLERSGVIPNPNGEFEIHGSTGGLANLEGEGTFSLTSGGATLAGTYSGTVELGNEQ